MAALRVADEQLHPGGLCTGGRPRGAGGLHHFPGGGGIRGPRPGAGERTAHPCRAICRAGGAA
ncbi:MAG TPA: hypothetical protein DDX54_04200 [Rhodospirillaceae bacterium]|nr:hypothetical protein [Rhodospirillaceae bacterium]